MLFKSAFEKFFNNEITEEQYQKNLFPEFIQKRIFFFILNLSLFVPIAGFMSNLETSKVTFGKTMLIYLSI